MSYRNFQSPIRVVLNRDLLQSVRQITQSLVFEILRRSRMSRKFSWSAELGL
jgi:hypothetical protein